MLRHTVPCNNCEAYTQDRYGGLCAECKIGKLEARVRELEEKLLILRSSIINAPIVLNFSGMIHRWSDDLVKMLDKKTGGGEE